MLASFLAWEEEGKHNACWLASLTMEEEGLEAPPIFQCLLNFVRDPKKTFPTRTHSLTSLRNDIKKTRPHVPPAACTTTVGTSSVSIVIVDTKNLLSSLAFFCGT